MKATRGWQVIEVTRGRGSNGPADFVDVVVTGETEEQATCAIELTPAEARELAAELTRVADAIEGEQR